MGNPFGTSPFQANRQTATTTYSAAGQPPSSRTAITTYSAAAPANSPFGAINVPHHHVDQVAHHSMKQTNYTVPHWEVYRKGDAHNPLSGPGKPSHLVGNVNDYYVDTHTNQAYVKNPIGWAMLITGIPSQGFVNTNPSSRSAPQATVFTSGKADVHLDALRELAERTSNERKKIHEAP